MKLVCWHLESAIEPDEAFCHQADYVAAHATGARVSGQSLGATRADDAWGKLVTQLSGSSPTI